ncbi:MAG: hypothetical protein LAQ30_02825 [Acidobacteriia bacterium]|nr:hypothetical protein [Terriglobia bacterium]
MELRYFGFDQVQNARAYRFDVVVAKGEGPKQFVVTVDLGLFRMHHVGIQEGPTLCANKLVADLGNSPGGTHQLTAEDMQAYADARTAAEARKAEARKGGRGRVTPPPNSWQTPWRGKQP